MSTLANQPRGRSSPAKALAWELWRRNTTSVWIIVGSLLLAWAFTRAIPDHFLVRKAHRDLIVTIAMFIATGSFVLTFGLFNYTEFDPGRDWTGFPYRLFVLPVRTVMLVGLPMLLGVVTVELVFLGWDTLVFTHPDWFNRGWFASLLGAYMVFYQSILWSLSAFRLLRIGALGFGGTSFIGAAFLPFFSRYSSSVWFSTRLLIPLVLLLAFVAFAIAWAVVARQRCGGGFRITPFRRIVDAFVDRLPRSRKAFPSPESAQFWFEWRRAGFLLPACVGALLLFLFGPLSFKLRHDSGSTLWTLAWLLLTPVLLAGALGKGFSRPDFWSNSLALPSFLVVRPLRSEEIIAAKMKVAALAAFVSWLLVVLFISLWLSFWADVTQLSMARVPYWMVYHHSVYPQYLIALLSVLAGAMMTWRLLVAGMWAGLSGSRKLFIGSAAMYWALVLLLVQGPVILLANNQALADQLARDPDRVLKLLNLLLAAAVVAKACLTFYSWRQAPRTQLFTYLRRWLLATASLVALGLLLWAGGTLVLALMAAMDFAPLDDLRLRSLLILSALLAVPIGRFGLVPRILNRNRSQ